MGGRWWSWGWLLWHVDAGRRTTHASAEVRIRQLTPVAGPRRSRSRSRWRPAGRRARWSCHARWRPAHSMSSVSLGAGDPIAALRRDPRPGGSVARRNGCVVNQASKRPLRNAPVSTTKHATVPSPSRAGPPGQPHPSDRHLQVSLRDTCGSPLAIIHALPCSSASTASSTAFSCWTKPGRTSVAVVCKISRSIDQ